MKRTEKCAACGRKRVCIRKKIGIVLGLPICLGCSAKAKK